MNAVFSVLLLIFSLAFFGILLVFAFYPGGVWLLSRLPRRPSRGDSRPPATPGLSMLVAARNAESHIGEKVSNCLSLDYDEGLVEFVFYSDGSTDGTEDVIRQCGDDRVKLFSASEHIGKTEALNRGVKECQGEIVVFSDADALLEPDALRRLVAHFTDPGVGGVCGQRVIYEREAELQSAQSKYIGFDSAIKAWESRLGRITSNDGKLYAIRRECFEPIAEAVTDDFFVCMTVIRKGYRFVFEPEARAQVRLPSRSGSHELGRRRRIVSRSLRGMFLNRGLFNPLRFGLYSLRLFVNKVLRRLVPVCLLLLFMTDVFLARESVVLTVFLILQSAFYLAALAYPVVQRLPIPRVVARMFSIPYYFCVGNYGTLLGVMDFLARRKITKWDPVKIGDR